MNKNHKRHIINPSKRKGKLKDLYLALLEAFYEVVPSEFYKDSLGASLEIVASIFDNKDIDRVRVLLRISLICILK